MSPDSEIQQRVRYLEESLCHEQRLLEELNQVVIGLRREIDRLEKRLQAAESRVLSVDQRIRQSEGDLPHEKPPHY
jgi:uncharacterized coiled-coil protein SlyX